MKNKARMPKVGKEKELVIWALYAVSILIILAGTYFSILSVVKDISIPVLSSSIHGAVFGVVVVFLGVRYLLSVSKLKTEVYKPTSRFTWKNFGNPSK